MEQLELRFYCTAAASVKDVTHGGDERRSRRKLDGRPADGLGAHG